MNAIFNIVNTFVTFISSGTVLSGSVVWAVILLAMTSTVAYQLYNWVCDN